jgi:hypothetical protein
VIVPRAFARPDEFFAAIDKVARTLPPEVESIEPSLGDDWDGEPAVFFQIVFAPGISGARQVELSNQIRFVILMDLGRGMGRSPVLPPFRLPITRFFA